MAEDKLGNGTKTGTLPSEYDAATKMWGEGWRMPTEAEVQELFGACEWGFGAINNYDGYWMINRSTGTSIFFPKAGYYDETGSLVETTYAAMWTSSFYTTSDDAYGGTSFEICEYEMIGTNLLAGFCGLPIRPVYDPQ